MLQRPVNAAVLIDGSALFFAVRELSPDIVLDYRAFTALLCRELGASAGAPTTGLDARVLTAPDTNPGSEACPWIMWTSASAHNEGQTKFLSFIEGKLGITVRRFSPADSMVIDQQALTGGAGAPHMRDRLTRFDASIAYMIGRLAENHQIVLVSDSFSLAEPMVRAMRARWDNHGREPQAPNVIAFFGRALDLRWHGALDRQDFGHPSAPVLRHLDLDDHTDVLFGMPRDAERGWWSEDIPGTSKEMGPKVQKRTR